MPTNQTKLDILREKVGDEAVTTLLTTLEHNHGAAVAAGIVEKAKKPMMMDEAEMVDNPTEEAAEPKDKKKKGGNPFAKKDDDEVADEIDSDTVDELALIAETVAETVGPAFDAIAARLDAFEAVAKEFKGFAEVRTKEVEQLKTLQDQVAALTKELAELRGDQPRAAAKGYRASTSADTITVVQKEGPKADNFFDNFINNFALGQPAGPVK